MKRILELGVMVEPEAAELLKNEKIASAVFERLRVTKERPFVLTRAEAIALASAPKLLKEYKNMTNYSIQDMISSYSNRYKAMQKMLLGKVELKNVVSIRNGRGSVAVIGLKRDGYIEDISGRERLITEVKLLDEDAIGVLGFAGSEGIRADRIIFPDIGLKEVALAPVKITIGKDVPLQGTALYECLGVKILVHDADYSAWQKIGVAEKNVPLEMLKRRHLNMPPNDVIEEVPDIFIVTAGEQFVQNYKGTTIIGTPKGGVFEIDLQTRDVAYKV